MIQKKGKSSEFSAKDDGHIKSGPAVKVWSYEGFILTSKIAKNGLIRLKKKCSTGLQKNFQGQTKGFLGCKGHTWAETIEKSNKNYQV